MADIQQNRLSAGNSLYHKYGDLRSSIVDRTRSLRQINDIVIIAFDLVR